MTAPANIGSPEYVSVTELAEVAAKIAGKTIHINYVDGPVGVRSRNFSNERIYQTGWKAKVPLIEGIKLTYPWIEEQVKAASAAAH